MKIKDLKIGTQLLIGFGAMLSFVMLLGIVSYRQANQIHKQTEMIYNHPLKVRQAIGSLNIDILNIRVAMRDLMITTDESKKQEIIKQIGSYEANVHRQFDVFSSRYLGSQKDIDKAGKAFNDWSSAYQVNQKLLEKGQINLVENNLSSTGYVGILNIRMMKEINDIDEFAKNRSEAIFLNSIKMKSDLNKQLILIVIGFIIIMLLISYFLIRSIRNPILELSLLTKQFRDGDLNVRSHFESRSEYGELSDSFNSMVQSIQTTTELREKTATLSELMLTQGEPKKFFISVLPALASYTNSQMAAVYLLSDDKKKYEHFHSFGMENRVKQSFMTDNFEGEFGSVLSTGKIQTIDRIPKDTRFIFHTVSGKLVPREIITIPVISGKEIVAIISLASIRSYSPQSELLIHNIQDTLSARIEGVIAYSKQQELARKLEFQNRELEAQKTELFAQSLELTEQNRELEIQKNQLNEANRLKTNFLSNMSHELRTPLNSVIALSGVLNRRLQDKIPADEYSYIEVIERNGKHLLSLINDVLDISRIEAGHEDIEISRFSTSEVISELVSMIEPQAQLKNIELVQKEGDVAIFITSDISKCRHILQNLIGNAVKFTETGKVEIEALQNDTSVEISVTDSGIGISEKNLNHIFDEFRQADGTTSRRYGGTGLGLAIAKKYANLLGGTIAVKSTSGLGSSFTLTLPLKYNQEDRIDEQINEYFRNKPSTSYVPGKISIPKTLLLVDDSEPAIIQLKDILEGANYKILEARDGAEALGLISSFIPDAIILDLMMPGIDGFEVLETLRNAEPTAHIPVLVLTAKQITKADLKFLKRNNVHQLIQKGDVHREELLNKVASLVFIQEKKAPKVDIREIVGTPTMLIIEDNIDNMTTVKALLGNSFNILEATDGQEGIKMAKKHIPHLILMDIALPGIDGIEAFNTIRQTGKISHIPIIALTASAMTSDRETILAHGFEAYIPKPIDDKLFFKTINKVLYGK